MKKKLLLVLIAVTSWGAWGQGAEMRTLKTDAGCTVVWPVGLTIQQPVQWTGRCENGLATGLGLLSYQFDTGSLGIARWHIKAMFVNGKENGVNWVVADPIDRQSNDSSFSMSLSIRRDGERLSRKILQPSIPLDQALQTADAMVSEAQSLGLPTMTADVLKMIFGSGIKIPMNTPVMACHPAI